MKIYFDNNIFVSIEDKEINYEDFIKKYPNYSVVYSYAHIQELLEAKNNLDDLKKRRIQTIKDIANNTYIYPNNDEICTKIEMPETVIQIMNTPPRLLCQNMLVSAINNFRVDREGVISQLSIDTKRINNYTPEDVIDYVNNATKQKLLIEFGNLVDLAGSSLRERICTLFNFLDIIGFWKDKKTEKSDLARVYDASHAFFASNCDFFISNDKRAVNKAKVAYSLYNINTMALSYDEFINLEQ
jgi:hypothetical protein